MILLTILNTLAIIYMLYKQSKLYIEFTKDTTFFDKTLVGYRIVLWKKTSEHSAKGVYTLKIPLKNKQKTETQEEVNRMIAKSSPQQKLQMLNAKFSWLKTEKEVKQFEKDYMCVDQKIVENLVSNFYKNK